MEKEGWLSHISHAQCDKDDEKVGKDNEKAHVGDGKADISHAQSDKDNEKVDKDNEKVRFGDEKDEKDNGKCHIVNAIFGLNHRAPR